MKYEDIMRQRLLAFRAARRFTMEPPFNQETARNQQPIKEASGFTPEAFYDN